MSSSSEDDWRSRLWNIKEEFTDVTISCFGKKKISTHKIIFSASSPFLHKMCSVSSKISLSEAPVKTVLDLIKFIYTGQVPTDRELYNDFLVLAKKLEVQGLPALKSTNNSNITNKSTNDNGNNDNNSSSNNQSKTNERKRKKCQSEDENSNSKKCKSSPELSKDKSNLKPSKKGLTDLPDEILLKVLSYMKTPDVVVKVSRVSHRFNQLSNDPSSHTALHLHKKYSTHYKTPELKQMLKFLTGKNKVKEVHLTSVPKSSLLDSFLDKTIVQQKMTRVIHLTNNDFCTDKILKLLVQHPGKARQLHRIVLPYFRFDSGIPQPDFANLTHLKVYCSDDESFNVLMKNASALQRLESLENSHLVTPLEHSEFFAIFLRARGRSLKKLYLKGYKCSDQDFELMTSVSTQLQVLEVNCNNVSLKNLQKIEDFENLLELNISVLVERFCQEVLSVCSKNTKLRNLKVSSRGAVVIELNNLTELYLNLTNKADVSKFLFSKVTKLKLSYDAQFDQYSAIDELKHLTDLEINPSCAEPDLDNILKLLDMVQRNGIQTFEITIMGFSLCYKSNSFTLSNANSIFQTKYLSAKHLSTILDKMKIFNPEKLSLSCYRTRLIDPTLQSITSLKTLKQLHLSLTELHYEEDNITKTAFEKLPHLKLLALNQLGFTDKSSDDVTWSMDESLFKIQRGVSTMFIPQKWIGGPSY